MLLYRIIVCVKKSRNEIVFGVACLINYCSKCPMSQTKNSSRVLLFCHRMCFIKLKCTYTIIHFYKNVSLASQGQSQNIYCWQRIVYIVY